MQLTNRELHADQSIERLPAFTLATALAWLGHDCDGTCPKQVATGRSNTWLIRPPAEGRPTGMRALVDVQFTDPSWLPEQGIAMMRDINRCTGTDRIHVVDVSVR